MGEKGNAPAAAQHLSGGVAPAAARHAATAATPSAAAAQHSASHLNAPSAPSAGNATGGNASGGTNVSPAVIPLVANDGSSDGDTNPNNESHP